MIWAAFPPSTPAFLFLLKTKRAPFKSGCALQGWTFVSVRHGSSKGQLLKTSETRLNLGISTSKLC